MTRAFPFAFAFLALILGAGARAEMPSSAFEVGGLRFGMTPEQAESAIKAYDSRMTTQTERASHRFRLAGGKTVTSDPFVRVVGGQIYGGDLKLVAVFPASPKGGGMIAAERYERDKSRSRPRAEYRALLIEKYGPPDAEVSDDARLSLIWKGKGVQCHPRPERLSTTKPVLEQIADKDRQMLVAGVTEPGACAPLLVYSLDDPVFAAIGRMVDVAKAAQAERDVDAWMRAEAAAAVGGPPTAKPKF